jgi:hypothetical protein
LEGDWFHLVEEICREGVVVTLLAGTFDDGDAVSNDRDRTPKALEAFCVNNKALPLTAPWRAKEVLNRRADSIMVDFK